MSENIEEYVLPVVLRLEKDSLLTHEEALEHMGKAMLGFLLSTEASEGGAWNTQIQAWVQGRFRKVVRRARGVKWDKVVPLGFLYSNASVEILIVPPVPIGQEPKEVKQLQVTGLDLLRSGNFVSSTDSDSMLVIGLNETILPIMSTGKAMAQVGHAVQLAVLNETSEIDEETLVAFAVNPEVELLKWTGVVRDAGFTEIPPNTVTTAYKIISA